MGAFGISLASLLAQSFCANNTRKVAIDMKPQYDLQTDPTRTYVRRVNIEKQRYAEVVACYTLQGQKKSTLGGVGGQ